MNDGNHLSQTDPMNCWCLRCRHGVIQHAEPAVCRYKPSTCRVRVTWQKLLSCWKLVHLKSHHERAIFLVQIVVELGSIKKRHSAELDNKNWCLELSSGKKRSKKPYAIRSWSQLQFLGIIHGPWFCGHRWTFICWTFIGIRRMGWNIVIDASIINPEYHGA